MNTNELQHLVCQELVTLRDYIRWAASQFEAEQLYFGHGTDNAQDEAIALVLHAVHLSMPIDDVWFDAKLTMPERLAVIALINRRLVERIPAAYLIGKAWFAGLPFKVDPRVLVPRSPIAELIEKQFSPWLVNEPEYILDLCTGSGCIGIACAYAFPDAAVDLADISLDALLVAEQNIADHQLQQRVRTIESDLFSGLNGLRYDLIVTNPPYVDSEDLADMPKEYHAEPELGLASGEDGLDFTRRLLKEAVNHLTDSGVLVCEVGNSCVALEEAYPYVPFTWIEFERGGHGVFVISASELKQALAAGHL